MRMRAIVLASVLAALMLSGALAVQAQDASPGADGSLLPAESPGAMGSPAVESPGAVESPAAAVSPAAAGSPAALASPAAGESPAADGATAGEPAHPAHIHVGSCPEPGDVVEPLSDVAQPTVEMIEGAEQVPLELSTTSVPLALADILGAEHAINVHLSADESDVYIACGDIGGQMTGEDSVAIVLQEQNDSGHTGFAWLTDQGDGSTRVDVILTRVLAEGVGEATEPGASPGAEMSPAAQSPGTEASPAAAEEGPAAASPAAPEASPAVAESSPAS